MNLDFLGNILDNKSNFLKISGISRNIVVGNSSKDSSKKGFPFFSGIPATVFFPSGTVLRMQPGVSTGIKPPSNPKLLHGFFFRKFLYGCFLKLFQDFYLIFFQRRFRQCVLFFMNLSKGFHRKFFHRLFYYLDFFFKNISAKVSFQNRSCGSFRSISWDSFRNSLGISTGIRQKIYT